jgi:hypothetical protein
MTRKKTSKKKALTKWDDQLAREAEIAAKAEANTGGGQFFSTQGGVLSWQEAPLPNNEMAVIILDTIFENVYYEGAYDADNPSPPTCFAFAHDEDELEPHQVVVDAEQHQSLEGCANCEWNEFGTADVGRGKACRNTRRLAMIPAGTFARDGSLELFEDPGHYASTTLGFLKLAVTSVKGYANYVKQIAGALQRPPFGVITRVSVVPDTKTQFKILFEPLEKVSDELMATIMERREEAMSIIDFPYPLEFEDEEPVQPRRRKKVAKKKVAKKRVAKKKTASRRRKY